MSTQKPKKKEGGGKKPASLVGGGIAAGPVIGIRTATVAADDLKKLLYQHFNKQQLRYTSSLIWPAYSL